MTNSRSTKSALLTSVVTILLCCTMLLGTTFAWFTDEASTGRNTIQAGNLDMKVSYKPYNSAQDWTEVDSTTPVFSDQTLYEPGYTEAVWLEIKNEGSLAFRSELGIDIYSEKEGVNVYNDSFKLSDYLVVRHSPIENIDLAESIYSSRESFSGLAYEGKFTEGENILVANNTVLKPGESWYYLVVIQMPTSVGNEANHNGEVNSIPEIEFGLNARAVQVPEESDAFGNDYDANADYVTGPQASVGVLDKDARTVNIYQGEEGVVLDTAYQFKPTETYEEAQQSPYRYWHADFVVSADKDVAAESMMLAGYYELYADLVTDGDWVGLTSPDAIPAGTEIRLVEAMSGGAVSVNYEELCNFGNDGTGFLCGAKDMNGSNDGTTITVELRLYETEEPSDENGNSHNVETGRAITVGTFKYTF